MRGDLRGIYQKRSLKSLTSLYPAALVANQPARAPSSATRSSFHGTLALQENLAVGLGMNEVDTRVLSYQNP
jgi:hypothetical protein